MNEPSTPRAGAARRTLLLSGLGGLTGAAALAGCTREGAAPAAGATCAPPLADGARHVARGFRGRRQAGIVEPAQPYAAFVAFDLTPGADADAVRRLLTVWTDDIERLTSGRGTLTDQEPELAAITASLTVTVGVGRRVVELAGAELPAWLRPLPPFPTIDKLEPRWSGGDLLLQVCATSPTTVAHAQRQLITGADPIARLRWVQRGFREPFEGEAVPMRNLLGQVDGTVQPSVTGPDDALLFAGATAPAWLREGSGVVVRRIRMDLEKWDLADRTARENSIGRRLADGSPLTAPAGAGASVVADLDATDSLGFHVIDDSAHLRRARAQVPTERFLRRPYSYDDVPEGTQRSDSGLIFVAYAADVDAQFVPVQRRLAQRDLLNFWTTPVGSAVFAVLPGARDGEILGHALVTRS